MDSSVTDVVFKLAQVGIDVDPSQLGPPSTEQAAAVVAESVLQEYVARGKLTAYQASAILGRSASPLVLSDYLLLEQLGGGGMGLVFKARHRVMDRVVAIKLIRPEFLPEARAVERF